MTDNENASDLLPQTPEIPAAASDAAPEPGSAEALKKRVYIGFAGIMAVAIALSGAYITGRVYADRSLKHAAGRPAAKAPVQAVSVPAAPAAAVEETKAAPLPVLEEKPAATASEPGQAASVPELQNAKEAPVRNWTVSNPQPGEKYLQLAALGPRATNWYVPALQAKGLHPIVAPGPEEKVYRILIGPFPDRAERTRRQEALNAAGIESIFRSY